MNPWETMRRARRDAESMADAVLNEAIKVGDVMTSDQAEKMRHALEAIAACGALNDDYLPEQQLMLEALRPFEGRWPLLMRAEEAEKEVARLRSLIEEQERGNHYNESNPSCPWCGIGGEWEGFESIPAMRHADDCPAFSSVGVVRVVEVK